MGRVNIFAGEEYSETAGKIQWWATDGNIDLSSAKQIRYNSGDKVTLNNYKDPPLAYEKDIVFLYLLFFISEDHKGKFMISEACQTRLKNIKRESFYDDKSYKAFSIPIQSIDEIVDQIPKIINKHNEGDTKKVIVAEMGFFSHAGGDGPISYNKRVTICPEPKYQSQMLMCGWEQVKVEWALNAKCVFYGCNTANTSSNWAHFALNISILPNFKNIEVWGQSTSSFPSFYPDYRVTSVFRSMGENGTGWDVRGNTYQIAGNAGEGRKAISYRPDKDTLSQETIESGGYPKANQMNYYKNGVLIKSSLQGVFNNHR